MLFCIFCILINLDYRIKLCMNVPSRGFCCCFVCIGHVSYYLVLTVIISNENILQNLEA